MMIEEDRPTSRDLEGPPPDRQARGGEGDLSHNFQFALDIQNRLGRVEKGVETIEKQLDSLQGRLSELPTKSDMRWMLGIVVTMLLSLAGLYFQFIRPSMQPPAPPVVNVSPTIELVVPDTTKTAPDLPPAQ